MKNEVTITLDSNTTMDMGWIASVMADQSKLDKITKLTIESTRTLKIMDKALLGLYNVRTIEIRAPSVELTMAAFTGCTALNSLIFPENTKYIRAFTDFCAFNSGKSKSFKQCRKGGDSVGVEMTRVPLMR